MSKRDLLVGKDVEEKLKSAEVVLRRLSAQQQSAKLIPVGPTIISGHIESGGTLYAYLPIAMSFDVVDIFVESIKPLPNEDPKRIVASMLINVQPLAGMASRLSLSVRQGHGRAYPATRLPDSTRISISFDRDVTAWLGLVCYPELIKAIPIEETPDEGISAPVE